MKICFPWPDYHIIIIFYLETSQICILTCLGSSPVSLKPTKSNKSLMLTKPENSFLAASLTTLKDQ